MCNRLLCHPEIDVDLKGNSGTPIIVFASDVDIGILKLFLAQSELSINCTCSIGRSVLYWATRGNKLENMKLLIKNGANVVYAGEKLKKEDRYNRLKYETREVLENWKRYLPEWTMWNHKYFPKDFKEIVVTWLLVVANKKYIKRCINKDMRSYVVQFIAAAYKSN